MRITKPTAITAAAAMLAAGSIVALPAGATAAVNPAAAVVINEVYGAGGNAGAVLTHDFIELRNVSAAEVNLAGWSVQYASTAGTNWSGVAPLSGKIPAGGHYLVQLAGGAAGVALPTPDLVTSGAAAFNMAGSNGNAALVNSTTALTCQTTACASDPAVIDLVGFGTGAAYAGSGRAPAPSVTTSTARNAASANTGDNAADFTAGVPTPTASGIVPEPPADPELTTIPAIQGTGAASPLVGQPVIVRGVVTAAYPAGGFFGYTIQTPGTGGTVPTASEGLSIRVSTGAADKAVGDYIEVTGTVGEFNGLTQVTAPATAVTLLAETVDPVTPLSIAWPTTEAAREAIESMLILPTDDFVVANTYATNQYGELGLATGGKPLIQPTDVARPGTPEYAAVVADNAARGVVLDDGASTNYLSTANQVLTPPYVSMTNPVRVGQSVTFVDPVVVDYRNAAWKFQPTATVLGPDNTDSPVMLENDRPATPDLAAIGDTGLTVAAFNVLNYFTTLGADTPGCTSYKDRDGVGVTVNSGCDPRGAWDANALGRQQAKIVSAINALDASVIGLMEIENSAVLGETADEATATLVAALNAASTPGKWAYVPSSAELPILDEQDVISNAIIYQPAEVELVGDMRVLGTLSGSGEPFSNAREPLGQAFAPVGGGDAFFVAVNHFKSKGSGSGLDADAGDGQGASNWSRVQQATALVDWVDSILPAYAEPVEAAFLLGDFNSYSMEDPMQVFYDAGYTDVNGALGEKKFSYSFSGLTGSLDHVVANEAAMARVTGSDIWNINAPESIALEYSRYNYHGTIFHAPDAYRSSDHDPVIVGLTADAPVLDLAEITLLNINDFHGRIDPGSSSPLTRRMALTIEQLRAAAPGGSLFLSAGDNIGASLFASSSADDVPTLEVLNALELGTSAVGNHEFDRGYDRLTTEVAADADFSYLGANVYHKGTTDPALEEYELFTVDGITIGVIGVVTEETPALVSPGGIATLDFGDPVEAVNRVAAQLSDGEAANGEADVIVAEYHEGANVDTSYAAAKAASAVFTDIATNTSADVDVIFMGHTHLKYAWDGEIPGSTDTRPIVQTGAYGANVGKVVLTVDKATGDVTAYTAENVAASSLTGTALSEAIAAFPRAVAVEDIVIDALADAAVIGSQVLGSKTADITVGHTGGGFVDGVFTGGTRDNRAAASTMGTLVGNALRDTASPAGEVADIGIVNPGGMRADFLMSAGADITVAQANAVLPFVNNVWFTTLTGEQFVQVLNQQWQRDAGGNVPTRSYLQLGLSDNVTYVADPTRPEGSRIVSVTIDGEPIDLAAEYRISSFSFLIQGGDNFRAFATGTETIDTGLIDRDAWFSYIEAESPLSPIYAKSGIDVTGLPTDATLAAGDTIDLTVGNINLTSQGAPENTSITVAIGDTELGDFPVTAGTATISVTIPADHPAGPDTLTITAPASGTTATIPVTVESDVVVPTFSDVPADHPFFTPIEALVEAGVIAGYSDGTFRPAASVTRQAVAAFLYRAIEGGDAPDCTTAPFSDVPVDHPFCGAIAWMVDEGITTGYSDGTFRPATPVSRQATAAFLARAFGPTEGVPACTEPAFSDVPAGHPFCGAIAWMVDEGITTGYSDGTFRPTADVTRQAMAAFLYRTMPA